jgi:hypothetical protein
MTKAWRVPVIALLLLFSPIGPAFTQQVIIGVASVIDGDTNDIHGLCGSSADAAASILTPGGTTHGRYPHHQFRDLEPRGGTGDRPC